MSKVRNTSSEEGGRSPWPAVAAIATVLGALVPVLIYLDSRKPEAGPSPTVSVSAVAPDPVGFELIEPKPEGPAVAAGCVPVVFKGTPPDGKAFLLGVWTPADGGYWFNAAVEKAGDNWAVMATLGADGFGMDAKYEIAVFLADRAAIEAARANAGEENWFGSSALAGSRELARIGRTRTSEPKLNC